MDSSNCMPFRRTLSTVLRPSLRILDEYVKFYNENRPCFAIGYDTPNNYRKRYYNGELPRKNTFASQELSPEPKFVRERRKKFENEEDK